MIQTKTLSSLLFIVFSISLLSSQEVHFKIYKGSKAIGDIHAKRLEKPGQTTYEVSSTASYRFLLKYVRESFTTAVFKDGVMNQVDLKITMNEDLKEHRITAFNGSGYDCDNKTEKEQYFIKGNIGYCTSMTYFKEPKGLNHIFVESFQQMCRIKLIEPNIYKLSLPEGKVNHYVYENGVLQEIRVFRKLINLTFKRV